MAMLVLAMFIFAGCTGGTPSAPDVTEPFIGGNGGLSLSFQLGQPPPEIFDNKQYPFTLGVQVENLGEADVGYLPAGDTKNSFVLMRVVGINPAQFIVAPEGWTVDNLERSMYYWFGRYDIAGLNPELNVALRGAKKNFDGTVIAGDTNTVIFPDVTGYTDLDLAYNYIPDIRGNDNIVMRAEACYDYSTLSTTKVCIKDQVLTNIQDDTICQLVGPKEPKNSGAPVHVSSLTQTPIGQGRIQAHFVIEHVGNGNLFRRAENQLKAGEEADQCYDTLNEAWNPHDCVPAKWPCDASSANPSRDVVHVRTYMMLPDNTGSMLPSDDPFFNDVRPIKCSNFQGQSQGEIKLYQGSPTPVTCTIYTANLGGSGTYTDTFYVELEYTYGDYIETPILIKDVSTNEYSG